jgi:hypothetical protein
MRMPRATSPDLGGAPAPRSTDELLSLSSQAKTLWLEHLGEIR